jgi:site-specific DNA-methyltransferase (adenine-specific)
MSVTNCEVSPVFTTQFHLHQQDCVKGMEDRIADESVDLVVTSPPYNLGIHYGRYDDSRSRSEYLEWTKKWAAQIKRVLKPTGSFFLNVGSAPSSPMLPFEMIMRMRELFFLQNTFHWIKSITVETRAAEQISVGHFKPIISHRFVNDCHEYVFHLTKTGTVPIQRLSLGVPYVDKSNISRWSHTTGKDKRCRGNTWFVPYKTITNKAGQRPHPATFPQELAENCISLQGNESNTVMMDPFLGIGTAAAAAQKLGVKEFWGFEIEPDYLKFANERLRAAD